MIAVAPHLSFLQPAADPADAARAYEDMLNPVAFDIRNSSHAAHGLAGIIETIEEADPTALLFVFGDHGPRLTQNLEFDDDPDFFVRDNYAVLGGIWPPDACEAWFDETLTEPYLTILDAVHTILRCLSGGSEALREPGDRTLSSYRHIPGGSERSLIDFLYE